MSTTYRAMQQIRELVTQLQTAAAQEATAQMEFDRVRAIPLGTADTEDHQKLLSAKQRDDVAERHRVRTMHDKQKAIAEARLESFIEGLLFARPGDDS